MPLGWVTFKPRHVSLAMPLAGVGERRCSRVVGTTLVAIWIRVRVEGYGVVTGRERHGRARHG